MTGRKLFKPHKKKKAEVEAKIEAEAEELRAARAKFEALSDEDKAKANAIIAEEYPHDYQLTGTELNSVINWIS